MDTKIPAVSGSVKSAPPALARKARMAPTVFLDGHRVGDGLIPGHAPVIVEHGVEIFLILVGHRAPSFEYFADGPHHYTTAGRGWEGIRMERPTRSGEPAATLYKVAPV